MGGEESQEKNVNGHSKAYMHRFLLLSKTSFVLGVRVECFDDAKANTFGNLLHLMLFRSKRK